MEAFIDAIAKVVVEDATFLGAPVQLPPRSPPAT
ncbi:hypothetical protein ABID41_001572 [Phenylobacterium koreense]|uniref:Uncharacterized protein n=1 Tax=Phenylobacterium koreense TaxID=266125 RepID=A0ABV2EHH8_9CAUL